MSDFDLEPPALPGSKPTVRKQSFFKRMFIKEDQPVAQTPSTPSMPSAPVAIASTEQASVSSLPQPPEPSVNLDEIKRKLGLDDEEEPPLPTTQEMQAEKVMPAPLPPRQVAIDDWAAAEDAPVAIPSTGPWDSTIDISGEKDIASGSSWVVDQHTGAADVADNSAAATVTKNGAAKTAVAKNATANNAVANTDSMNDTDAQTKPAHHEVIDQHLAALDQAHQQILDKLGKATAKNPEMPEWKLQEKEVLPEQYFILRNGQTVKSLAELVEAIDYIDDSTFEHHVSEYRNDFANWIRDVVGDVELASAVQAAEDKAGVLRELLDHKRQVARKVVKEQEKLQQTVKARQQTVKTLAGVETQITTLERELAVRTKELQGERHRSAKLLKDKLDAEVTRRLEKEKRALQTAREDLAKARDVYKKGADEYQALVRSLDEREKQALLKDSQAKSILEKAKREQERAVKELQEAAMVVDEAKEARAQIAELKRLEAQTKQNLDAINKQGIALSRREETLRQREKKTADDLTKISQESEKLITLRSEHAEREAAVKKQEADAKKQTADAERRTNEALAVERDTRAKMKAETTKLETLRKQVDKLLAKTTGEKKKITNAIALRKQLVDSIQTVKKDVATERKQLEEEGFQSYMKSTDATTPVGQPASIAQEDERMAKGKNAELYKRIEECRLAVERNDLVAARRLYNELRELYVKVDAPAVEKNAIYTTIREIYDDIHLALLN